MGALNAVAELLESGGDVLWLILFVSICLWSLIFERLVFFKLIYPKLRNKWISQWQQAGCCKSKDAFHIKNCLLSEAKISMGKSVSIIKMLIAICPMLGLLGTVVGMIPVFDVMAVTGTGNARSMASGISQATISTMVGKIIAISGLYYHQLAVLLK
jgi:biopolymer transport protein ExbB